MALDRGRLNDVMFLLESKNPSVSKILAKGELFSKMLKVVQHSEMKLISIKLLSRIEKDLDLESRKIARNILRKIIIRIATQITGKGVSPKKNVRVEFQPEIEEFDIEQTFENIIGKKYIDHSDIVSIKRVPKKRAISLILDISNSMQSEKIALASLAVGVLAQKLRADHYSIITFKNDTKIVKSMTKEMNMENLIDKMLSIQTGGLTNIESGLKKGLEELEKVQVLEKIGIIITDGWATEGGDPIEIAKKYPKLHVIQVPLGIGGGDPDNCMKMAKIGRGKYSRIKDFNQLPDAIIDIIK